ISLLVVASRRNRSPSPIMVTLESSESGPSGSAAISESAARTRVHRPRAAQPAHQHLEVPAAASAHTIAERAPTQTSFVVPAPADEQQPRRSIDDWAHGLRRATSFGAAGYGYSTRGGELVRPPPPLLRPTTFWRKAHRSGVAAATYSPSAHLIRRSTYIAAGLAALHVEARLHGEDGVRGGGPRVVEIPQAFELLGL
ncbi:hypothetical protein B0H14DRAFT_3023182, partial [Mycena olivaceomarginata]